VQPRVWIVGDWQHADFQEAMAWLESSADCSRFSDPNDARIAQPSPRDPHAILVVQSRPAQFTRLDVERLHSAAPLARLLVLTGPWCEGEARTGRPWPGVTRVPWRSWRSRLSQELGLQRAAGSGSQLLPRTTTEAERIERSVAATRTLRFHGQAHVYADSRVTFDTLADLLRQLGLRATWRSVGEQPAPAEGELAIIDGWDHVAEVSAKTRILLLHFPRPEDAAKAAQLGIAAVLSQPLLLMDMAETLADYPRLLDSCGRPPKNQVAIGLPPGQNCPT